MHKSKFIISTVLSISLLSTLTGCTKKDKEITHIERPVKIMDIMKEDSNIEVQFSGITVPENSTALAFKVAGPIEDILVIEGQKVKKNQILAKMDVTDYNLNLKVFKEKYLMAKAAADNMSSQYKRAKILHDGKAMSDKNFDIITAQYKSTIATLKTAETGVTNAKNQLKDIYLKAPYDGFIGKIILDKGAVVGAGLPILTIISNTNPKVTVNVAGKDIANLNKADSFIYKLGNKDYRLKLQDIAKNPDLIKLTYLATFQFIDKNVDLLAGSTGIVVANIPKNNSKDIYIPVSAVFENDGSKVYIYENGIVKMQSVELGELTKEGNVKILSGLNKNDKVIIAGVHTVKPGEKVRILDKPSDTNIGGLL